ncbi:hypothetical protein ACFS2C_08105 [Prauserella oleivorans]|uniref:Uncharacterized protein n=1 Tax=Prauserella oleivorans TaxID=1478153 RepID=A0ABW5W707_9PSEU
MASSKGELLLDAMRAEVAYRTEELHKAGRTWRVSPSGRRWRVGRRAAMIPAPRSGAHDDEPLRCAR